jgi:hypothetical protein
VPQADYSPMPQEGASEYVPPQETELPLIPSMTPERTGQIIRTVYMKIYHHVFGQCQFSTNHGPDRPFLWPEGATHTAIRLTPEEQAVCYAMDCHDTAGRVCVNIPTTRGVVGRLNYKKNLPMYDLFFNFMGRRLARRVVPQNPAKRAGNGTYSALAVQAQQGHKIMHVFENDPAIKEHNKRTRKFDGVNKIVDGTFDQ